MSATNVDSIQRTLQQTTLWLKGIMLNLEIDNAKLAFEVLRAVLHALRDRIGPENAVHLAAQLPMLIRGVYFEGWKPSATPTRERHLAYFLDHVAEQFPAASSVNIEAATRAVFDVLAEHLDPGEIDKVVRVLPREVRQLWLQDIVSRNELRLDLEG